MHLQLDGYSTHSNLNNAEIIRAFISDLANLAGMTIVNGPTVHSFRDSIHPEYGLSAFAIIAESHISVHTWPDYNYITVDLFSCRPFDVDAVRQFIQSAFSIFIRHHNVQDRSGPPTLYK